jgi:hypothetical protein
MGADSVSYWLEMYVARFLCMHSVSFVYGDCFDA